MKNTLLIKTINISTILLFLLMTGSAIYFNYHNWKVRKLSINQSSKLSFLQNDNKSISEKKDYFNSDNYKNKLFKTENLKNADEVVIRLENPETYMVAGENEYSIAQPNNENNFNNWLNCIFFKNNSTNNNNYCK